MQWRILDDNVEIDLSYITCAEYQLFIDEKRQAGENRQPAHWKDYRFLPGDSQKPITGVRASDAAEFCEWLTRQHSELGFRYRLPTLAEVKEYSATKRQIGCWCRDEGEYVIAGIEATQWQNWYSKLAEVVVLNRDLSLYFYLNRVFKLNLYFYLNRVLKLNLDRDFYFNRDQDFYRDQVLSRVLNRVLNQYLNRVLNQYLNRVLNRELDFYLNRVLNRALNQDLNQYLNRVLSQYLNRVLNRYLNQYLNRVINLDLWDVIEADEARDFLILYFPLLFFIVIYQVLSLTYQELSQNREALKHIKLSCQQSESLSRKYQQKIDEIYPLYVYLVLLDERQAGRIPAWEGIRLVRERIDS
ncbi:MAG: SUMF1/EgtB/PvdO family nonheme iron enzyme [Symploca sp. SIO3E6]|nr:SUMF1/EgtB/PvdO family nonheme iron enzyme [Caldora sp. SIO3E6]